MAGADVTAVPAAPPRPSFALGAFVVFQLAFLLVYNLGRPLLAQRDIASEPARTAVEQVAPGWRDGKNLLFHGLDGANRLCARYAEATFQYQDWSLFAPDIGLDCVFPAVAVSDKLPWDVEIAPGPTPESYEIRERVLLSDNEPEDLKQYGRWGNFRLRRYENNFVVYLTIWDDETPAKTAERWRDKIRQYVSDNAELLLGYLRWRLERHGEPMPRAVILLMRRYRLQAPEAGADFYRGPFVAPVARWRPQAPAATALKALECFNPVTGQFERASP